MKQKYSGWLSPRMLSGLTALLFIAVSSDCVTAESKHDPANARQLAPHIAPEHWRVIKTEIEVDGAPEEAWSYWTTVKGQEEIFGARVILELQTMGLHEVWFLPDAPAGQRGHENGRIIGWQRHKMLAFTWTMPPYMPMIRSHQTFVQLFFEPVDDARTRIILYHTGFGTGREWDEGYDYFVKVWPSVLSAYSQNKAQH